MQDLRVIGVENGALLVASDDGERFRIPIDEMMQSRLRQTLPEPGAGRKLSPREIQGHIRGGMSAEDVAAVTGVPLDYIRKYEGPVLAEREFIVETALSVAVHMAVETDPATTGSTFGTVITTRLQTLGATTERWSSWKEEGAGWVVKLSYTTDHVDHDARWRFDPKKLALSPLNAEATTLSQQGDAAGALIPRLRAVGGAERETDATRFDSGAFALDDLGADLVPASTNRFANRAAPDPAPEKNQTADLLEALRRRRGEREAASYAEADAAASGTSGTTTSLFAADAARTDLGRTDATYTETTFTETTVTPEGIRIVEIEVDTNAPADAEPAAPEAQAPASPTDTPARSANQTGNLTGSLGQTGSQPRVRRGRAAMPSWDDIVFGARPDDDLA